MAAMLGAAILLGAGGCGYEADLTTSQVVPPTALRATGDAAFRYDKVAMDLGYEVNVEDIEGVNGAAVYLGREAENGEKVLDLYGSRKEGVFSGRLVRGTAKSADLVGPLAGKPMSDLVKAFDEERAYLLVNNEKYPAGAIRGQILHKPWYKFW